MTKEQAAKEKAEKLYPYAEVAQGDYSTEQKYVQNRKKMDKYRKAFLTGVENSGTKEWISVEERLPKSRPGWSHSETVLVAYDDGLVSVGAYRYLNTLGWEDHLYDKRDSRTIIYWMPLPTPPVKQQP